jgi:thiosulfate dehydrogenase [quinone] large subunit
MMATATTQSNSNVFESTLFGFTVHGKAHSLSAWFVLSLRLMMGYAFLHAGLDKVLEANWTAGGYLSNVAANNGNPLAEVFAWMAGQSMMMHFVNVAVPWGELLIGIALLAGAFTRLAAFWGAFMMAMFYFGNWNIEHGIINGDFAYMLVFLAVAAFGAGRIIGLDTYIEQLEVGGTALVEKYPWMRYLLG